MIPDVMQDLLIIKSAKLALEDSSSRECFFHFQVFQMHPFGHMASFRIDGTVFPGMYICYKSFKFDGTIFPGVYICYRSFKLDGTFSQMCIFVTDILSLMVQFSQVCIFVSNLLKF